VMLGALTTYTEVRRSAAMRRDYPLLCQAAAETGGLAIQNRGTLGGNVANASPAADSPPALLVYDAELELVSPDGVRRVPYASFHRAYRKMDLGTGELIRAIHLPRRPAGRWREVYRKVGTRRAQAISKICFAGALALKGGVVEDVRLALGSVAPLPLLLLALLLRLVSPTCRVPSASSSRAPRGAVSVTRSAIPRSGSGRGGQCSMRPVS